MAINIVSDTYDLDLAEQKTTAFILKIVVVFVKKALSIEMYGKSTFSLLINVFCSS